MGTRDYLVTVLVVFEDHPHACGDKAVLTVFTDRKMGSSPRVWGQVCFALPSLSKRRIIPTRVGTRRLVLSSFLVYQDHPHACGDKG